jgi:hypothetical protein
MLRRIAFDPDRPLVATSAFPDGTVAAGEVFDWRAKGSTELDALALFQSGLLAHPSPLDASPVATPTKPRAPRR